MFCSTLLKNTSKSGCQVGGLFDGLSQNVAISLKLSEALLQK